MADKKTRNLLAAFVSVFLSVPAAALQLEDIPSALKAGAAAPPPQAAAAKKLSGLQPSPAIAAREDALLNSMTSAQWDELFRSPLKDQITVAFPATKEFLSDFHVRYIVEGVFSRKTAPPTFTTLKGKVFSVVGYPELLEKLEGKQICVEGYAKQQDDTSKLRIARVLPPSAAEDTHPPQEILDRQKHPYIISKTGGKYTLGNARWALQHTPDGALLKDNYGNILPVWAPELTINPQLLEAVYVAKKINRNFPYTGTHAFLMFKFKPGGAVDQAGNNTRGVAVSLNVYYKSLEHMNAYTPYVIAGGLQGKYMVYHNISTIESYLDEAIFRESKATSFYPVAVSREKQAALLDTSLTQATSDKTGEMYDLFYNSCTNLVVSLINSVLEEDRKIRTSPQLEFAYRFKATMPDTATTLLRQRGVIEAPAATIDESNYKDAFAD